MSRDDGEDENGEGVKAYDPNQDIEERRSIAMNLRVLQKELNGDQAAFLKADDTRLTEIVHETNENFAHIKQTSDAAVESKVFLSAVEINDRRMGVIGGISDNGVNPNELLTKVIAYMRRGAGIADDEDDELTHTQRNRRRPATQRNVRSGDNDEYDEDGVGDDMMNWPHLGRYAAVPHVRRPALPGFLIGPLSVQKKARRLVVRTAPLRIRDIQEVRPEVLKVDDIEKNEAGDLTAICVRVFKQLKRARDSAHKQLQKLDEDENVGEAQVEMEMERLGIAASGNIDMMRFCINPHSFGQTVENMFYVSFLIRDGHVHVDIEENGLPSLSTSEDADPSKADTSKNDTQKHQAVLAIDMPMWRDLIKTFNIKEPMIAHRQEVNRQGPGAKGWYG